MSARIIVFKIGTCDMTSANNKKNNDIGKSINNNIKRKTELLIPKKCHKIGSLHCSFIPTVMKNCGRVMLKKINNASKLFPISLTR